MDSFTQSFANSTPPQWLTVALLLLAVFFLKRLLNTFDKMQSSIEQIKETIVKHDTTVGDHERRIDDLEDKVFK